MVENIQPVAGKASSGATLQELLVSWSIYVRFAFRTKTSSKTQLYNNCARCAHFQVFRNNSKRTLR